MGVILTGSGWNGTGFAGTGLQLICIPLTLTWVFGVWWHTVLRVDRCFWYLFGNTLPCSAQLGAIVRIQVRKNVVLPDLGGQLHVLLLR